MTNPQHLARFVSAEEAATARAAAMERKAA